MPSLDGYSLNEKMDKKFEDIDEKIEVLKFRLDEDKIKQIIADAWEFDPDDDEVKNEYEDLKDGEIDYNKDILSGNYIEYYIEGQYRGKGKMKNDEMHGKWTFWYHNGQKECEVTCKNGELIDCKVWDDDGNRKKSIRFNYQR